MSDKVTLTIVMERVENGTVKISHKIEGEGFHYFEMIGLMEMVKLSMAQKSDEVGKIIPEGKPTKIKFTTKE